jgi:hypothetical protein
MSEQRLDRSDVDTAIIEVRCKTMAQRVQVDRLPDPRRIGGLVEQPVELARRQRPARLAARKEQALLHGHAAKGEAAGTAELDNARVIAEQAARVAAFR